MDLPDKLFNSIVECTERENDYLINHFSNGIFFVPELAFGYLCGKEIMENQAEIFEGKKYTWIREKQYVYSKELADHVFIPGDKKDPEIVIEFKMDGFDTTYVNDMKKLARIDGNSRKFFCGLKWVYEGEENGFIERIEKLMVAEGICCKLKNQKTFETIYRNEGPQDYCFLSLWEVGLKCF